MSERGAAGILERAGKTPKSTKKLDLAPTGDGDQADADALPAPAPSSPDKAAAKDKPSKAGAALGQSVGKSIGSGISYANQGAGFVLGLLVWGWLVRPFLDGGVPGVKAVLMAKFFNKGTNGKEL